VCIDLHGNPSRVLEVGPGHGAAELAPLLRIERFVDHLALSWRLPAPGMSALIYRGSGDGYWSTFGQQQSDENGVLRYEDFEVRPGFVYEYRLGVLEAGHEVLTAPTAGTTLIPELALRRVWPTPVHGGALNIDLALPNATPTRLELIDISGRIVRQAAIEGLGAGRHAFEISTLGVPPGVYLVRMVHGTQYFTRRVVVLP
jgi:hypothetical protein